MVTRRELDYTALVSVIGIVLIIILLSSMVLEGTINLEGFVVGVGTFLLAMATFYLAYTEMAESIKNRIQYRELAEKDRRRRRLKEQLEGLYSPLISIGETDFLTYLNHRYTERERAGMIPAEKEHFVHKKMAEIRSKYNFLATFEMKQSLDVYYGIDFNDLENENRIRLLSGLWIKIKKDFSCLSIEYSDLTKS